METEKRIVFNSPYFWDGDSEMYLQESRMEKKNERKKLRKRKIEYMTSCNKGIKGRKKDCHNLRAKKIETEHFWKAWEQS